jgi:predicted nucleic acid-binding protein
MPATDAFFDTNVLLYLLSGDAVKADRAERLLSEGGVVSVQVLNEFASVGLRKLSLTVPEIRELLATVRAVCAVKPVDLETHELGLDLTASHQLSLYDAMIVSAALRANCAVVFSEDMQHGQTFGQLVVRNPFR